MTLGELRSVLERAVATASAAELPDVIGEIAAAQARAMARLTAAPAPAPASTAMMSAEEIAAALGVKASAVLEWARAGKIPVAKFGRFSRFDLAAVRAALEANSKTVRLGAPKTARPDSDLRGPLTTRLPRQDCEARRHG
jgi:excisionase family DNA binding protein